MPPWTGGEGLYSRPAIARGKISRTAQQTGVKLAAYVSAKAVHPGLEAKVCIHGQRLHEYDDDEDAAPKTALVTRQGRQVYGIAPSHLQCAWQVGCNRQRCQPALTPRTPRKPLSPPRGYQGSPYHLRDRRQQEANPGAV